ncbi:MAG: hypothetical protein M3O33_18185 [Cyanobacteriota bacterium]|nr:hypothetical protein [Cyanobacteriota bacterium]
MRHDYYGLQISALPKSDRWKWQIVLPFGEVLKSYEDYSTAEQALVEGKRWIDTESTFDALNRCLSELCGNQMISKQEYCNLMESFIGITEQC